MKKKYYLIGIILLLISLIFDKQISIFFTSYRIDFLSSIAVFMDLFKWYYLFGIVLIIILIKKEYKKIPLLILSFGLYGLIVNGLKIVIGRERPFVELKNELVETTNPYRSFPSGHATSMFTLLPFLDFIYVFWLILSILVSLSRVYLGVHYLSDIIAGALIGLIIPEISKFILKKYETFTYRKV